MVFIDRVFMPFITLLYPEFFQRAFVAILF
jgi:hypothetical protein